MGNRDGTMVAAVDLGAGSVRVCVCDLDHRPVGYEVIHRVSHQPAMGTDGVLRWDWNGIRTAVLDGLEQARQHHRLRSIGIDTWAVDYGLLDGGGNLLAPPVCYRDARTAGFGRLVDRIGADRLFAINGLQMLAFNTIFQLDVEDRSLLDRARWLLTLPELLVHELTGEIAAETTSAGATGLVDQRTGDWSSELLDRIAVDPALFPEIQPPASRVGDWKGVPVHLVAGHDTASAVVGIAAVEANPGFVSSGTWIIAGQELSAPVLTPEARAAGCSNEYGPSGTTRFLRNIAGFWIIEECRRQWKELTTAELLDHALVADAPEAVFDATDPRFLAPQNMEAEVLDAAGLPSSTPPPATVAVIVNSLAATTADVLSAMTPVSGTPLSRLHLIGGGVRSPQFVQRLASAAGIEVCVGAAEAAILGNALVQGIALGCWDDVADARKALIP